MRPVFSSTVLRILGQAGWTAEYRHDVRAYQRLLHTAGCPLSQAAEMFLVHYGGLYLISIAGRNFDFDVLQGKAADYYISNYACTQKQFVAEIAQVKVLHDIGHAYHLHLSLLMSDTGAVYGAYDDYVWHIGDDTETAIESLCHDAKFTALSEAAKQRE